MQDLQPKRAISFYQLNILRCFVLPVAYGIFLAVAQVFLVKPSNARFVSVASLQVFFPRFI